MNERRISIRLNMNKHSHKMAYEIYQAIPASQRSDFIRLAIILMNDRDEQLNRMKNLLSLSDINVKEIIPNTSNQTEGDFNISDGMIDFINDLQINK